ncbi:MAG: sodium:calcium antiporter, partial [Lachnospiraceae bacterium]|nr:sodium:calcium antiporter [Lachnospiraceae bacterium]
VPVEKIILKRDIPFSIGISALLLLITSIHALTHGTWLREKMDMTVGNVGRFDGSLLLVLFICYIVYLILDAKKKGENTGENEFIPIWKCFVLILIGLVLIISGGEAVVYGAKGIAKSFGMSETLIGLTIVAVGTSLPELVTSIVAARKGETGLAVGNVIGSNIFNILFILGVSSTIHPIGVNVASVYDMIILIGISILALLFSLRGRVINRSEGAVMILIYVADVIFAAIR